MLTLLVSSLAFAANITIVGAGATFPYPLYAKWSEAYKQATNNTVTYQSIGSGGGIKMIRAGTVDFGASDMPLSGDQLQQGGLVQFPVTIGGVVPVVNLEGIAAGQLKLTGPVLADIYMGKITRWDDPAIKNLNPAVKLPSIEIVLVYRSDGSGTTFLWAHYLSQVSTEWKEKFGSGTTVNWPKGVGGKGNEGVSNFVQKIKGSIGYVEYAYAKKNKITYAQVKNRAGNFVSPTEDAFQAASSGADWNSVPGMGVILTDQAGATSWPITGASFILMYRVPANAARSKATLDFFSWSLDNGRAMSDELDYVHLPVEVIRRVRQEWQKIQLQ
jgi:phosphate transport system substrate-binding protein